MDGTPNTSLRAVFMQRYDQLRRYLRVRLGSEELAHDALHETYLRVEGLNDGVVIKHASAYLFRVALNVADDQRKKRSRLLSTAEVEHLYELADELADPVRTVESQGELDALERALAELPPRRRAIVIAARVNDQPHRDIAACFGISARTVEKELRAGLEHCCERLGREFFQRFGPGAGKTSKHHE